MLYDPSCWHKKITRHNYWEWRAYMKLELVRKRGWKSDYSGRYLSTCEMHEGILTRANVPLGVPFFWMIYHEYNCFLLLSEEHRPQPPTREWCIKKSFERYGEENVVNWFNSIPFKVRPFNI